MNRFKIDFLKKYVISVLVSVYVKQKSSSNFIEINNQNQTTTTTTGFSRATYLHSKIKNKGACKAFWRQEKRFRYVFF